MIHTEFENGELEYLRSENEKLYKIIDEKVETIGDLILENNDLESLLRGARTFAHSMHESYLESLSIRGQLQAELGIYEKAFNKLPKFVQRWLLKEGEE